MSILQKDYRRHRGIDPVPAVARTSYPVSGFQTPARMNLYQWLLCTPWIMWVIYLVCVLIHELRIERKINKPKP